MAFSTQTAVSDGTLVNLALSLEYLDRSEISVEFDGIEVPDWAWVGVTDTAITFSPAVPNGVVVTVRRTTQIAAAIHNFEDGAQFRPDVLDENFAQTLHILQELAEGGEIPVGIKDERYIGAASTP